MQVIQLDSTKPIPLSWILLRSAFFKSGELYVENRHLQEVASKLGITKDKFEEFLAAFTAMGSLIYNPRIKALEQHVILNPVDFCFRLNDLFIQRFDGDLNKGVVPMSYLRRVYGKDAAFFRDVLTSSKYAIQVDAKKIKYIAGSDEIFPERLCYFFPIICEEVAKVEKNASSLFLQVKSTFLPNNVGQLLVERLLLDTSVSLIPTEYSNVVSFEYKANDGQNFVTFSVVFHADACEICLKSSDGCKPGVIKAVRSLLLDSCRYVQNITKETLIPFGTEIQDMGVLCTTSGGFHSFPTEKSCQECAGPVNVWQPIYAEVGQCD